MSARLPDLQRDATKYGYLINALKRALREIHDMESIGNLNIDTLLTKLLPVIAKALDAEKAFVAKEMRNKHSIHSQLSLLATYPKHELAGNQLNLPEELNLLLVKNQYYVHDPVGIEQPVPVPGLEMFGATSAVLKGLRVVDQQYVVGVCDKRNQRLGPFLVADRIALDSILELIAAGVRSFERHRREHEAIQLISQTATRGNMEAVWQVIAKHTTELTQARYTTLVRVDKPQSLLRPVGTWDGKAGQWHPQGWTLPISAESLNGHVVLTGMPHYLPDIKRNEKHYKKIPGFIEDNIKSAFSAPLHIGAETIGTIYLASTEKDGINADAREFVIQLAPHAAIALQNAQLLEDARRQLKIDDTIIRLQKATADLLSKKDQARQIREELQELNIDTSGFYMATFNEGNNRIEFLEIFVAGREVQKLEEPRQLNEKRGFTDYVLCHRTPLFINDLAEWSEREEIELEFRQDVYCCLVIPLQHQEEFVGVMGLLGHRSTNMYTQGDFDLLKRIAPHLAIVIKNSQVYEQRVQEFRAVSTFQQEISDVAESEQAEIDSVYGRAHAALQGVGLDTEHMMLVLYRKESDKIEFPLVYERGKLVEDVEKSWQGKHPMYATRLIGDRGDLPEYIIVSGTTLLGKTQAEIQAWQHTLPGVRQAPTRSKSWIGTPMSANGELIGMIALRHFERENTFQEHHLELLKTVAAQTAVAIKNARQYQQIRKQAEQMKAVNAAGKTIAQAGLDRTKVFDAILEQAVKVTGANLSTFQLLEDNVLKFVASIPKENISVLQKQFGEMPLHGKGITVRAARLNHAQLVPDVSLDPDFLDGSNGQSGCEVAVVLRRGDEKTGRPIGVINVEHHEKGKLSIYDRDLLIALSNLAVLALDNVEQAETLQSANAVALMAAWGAELSHDVNSEVGAIRREILSLRYRTDLPLEIEESLLKIDKYAEQLSLPELPNHPSEAEKYQDNPALVDEVIAFEVAQLQDKHRNIEFACVVNSDNMAVIMPAQWIRRVLHHLVSNALKHPSPQRDCMRINIWTERVASTVEVHVSDNGAGIDPLIKPYLFKRLVPRQGQLNNLSPGAGLILVNSVTERHGGRAWLQETSPTAGSHFVFSIPVFGGQQTLPY